MSALIVILKTGQRTHTVRFTYEDGRLMQAIELLATYLMELGAPESVHEEIAAERLATILRQDTLIRELRPWALLAGWGPAVREAAR